MTQTPSIPPALVAKSYEEASKLYATQSTALPVTEHVVKELRDRAAAGLEKYGTTLDRSDLTVFDWMQHLKEELLDGAGYLEKLKRTFAQLLPDPDLVQRCQELEELSRTGILADGRVRELARTMPPLSESDRMTVAIAQTKDEAMAFVLAVSSFMQQPPTREG